MQPATDHTKQLAKVDNLIDEACDEVRKIAHDMASNNISDFGLRKSIQLLAERVNGSAGLQIQMASFGMSERFDRATEISLYRVVQEIISNVLKHARATVVEVNLTRNHDSLNILIEDNGIGFDPSKSTGGLGLKSIESRVESLNGTIVFDSAPGRGTTVSIDIELSGNTPKPATS